MKSKIISFCVLLFLSFFFLFNLSKEVSAQGNLCTGYLNCCYGYDACCDAFFVYPDCGPNGICLRYERAPCYGCQPPNSCSAVTENVRLNCENAGGSVCSDYSQNPPGSGPGCSVSNNVCGGGGCSYNCGDGVCCSSGGETSANCSTDCGGGGCVWNCGDTVCCSGAGEDSGTCPEDCGGGYTDFTINGFVGLDANKDGIWNDGDANKVEDTNQTDCGSFYNLSPVADLRIAWINNSVGGDFGEINYHTSCGPLYSITRANDGMYNFTLNNLPANYHVAAIEASGTTCTLSGNTAICGQLSDGHVYTINFIIQSDDLPCPTGFNVSCAPSGNQATISWNPLAGAASYFLRANRDPYGDWFGPGDVAQGSVNTFQTITTIPDVSVVYDVQGRRPGEPWPYSGARCPFVAFSCPLPTPSCTVTLDHPGNPYMMPKGLTEYFNAYPQNPPVNGTVDHIDILSSNNSILTPGVYVQNLPVNVSRKMTASGLNGQSATVAANVYMRNLQGVLQPSPICTVSRNVEIYEEPFCTITVSANPSSISVGESSAISASATVQSGSISNVNFTSNPSGAVTFTGQNPDPTFPYGVIATGETAGSPTITATATMNEGPTCNGSTILEITNRDPWWQVKDADVSTNGNLNSKVPTGLFFDLAGSGNYPGIPAYGGSTDTINRDNVSTRGWLANSSYNAAKRYDYNYFNGAIPSGITPAFIETDTVDGSYFTSGGTPDSQGNYWYKYNGGSPNFTIQSSVNLGARKVILFVEGADVKLQGNITLDDGSGFFLLVANNDIITDPIVSGAVTDLEGIFVTDQTFQTGSDSTQLRVRGTVAAYGGIQLSRNLGSDNNTTPAELFELAPDLILRFPNALGTRNMTWQEVAP